MTGKAKKRLIVLGSVVAVLVAMQIFLRLDLWVAGLWHWETSPIGHVVVTPTSQNATSGTASTQSTRPAEWAQRMSGPGLSNFFKVSDDLYRGAQPEAEGFATLEKMGIKTVVNLRFAHDDRAMLPAGNNFSYYRINFDPFHPEMQDVREFLKIVRNRANYPIFVHCQHGSDRTGTMVAVYRATVQGWTMEQALAEMTQGDFGYHEQWVNLIEFLRRMNLEELRKGNQASEPVASQP